MVYRKKSVLPEGPVKKALTARMRIALARLVEKPAAFDQIMADWILE